MTHKIYLSRQQLQEHIARQSEHAPAGQAILDLDELLAAQGEVAVPWCIDDVLHERPQLTRAQAWEVLQECKHKHDAELGFTWELIRCLADDLYPTHDNA